MTRYTEPSLKVGLRPRIPQLAPICLNPSHYGMRDSYDYGKEST